MTVYELKAILADVPDDHQVLLAHGDEGSDFLELQSYSKGHYDDHEYTDEQEMGNAGVLEDGLAFNCIALWP